ncbi:ribosomal RNA small subunit methyltransferase A [Candidatus Babeliales bacterium]|nr:ribosomal RNA small subunit methyltransferase A [Candidatus Babeliales bacterium]
MRKPQLGGITVKKKYGQHFLKDQSVIRSIISAVELTDDTSVFEIGCGEGILTRAILQTPVKRLWVFEIDQEWAEYVRTSVTDDRITIFNENFLDVDLFGRLSEHQPWVLLANLPYQVTFPILHKLQAHRSLLKEGVIMIQEEVAQKILKTSGRGYGYPSIFFQHYFIWKKLDKVLPSAFYPPPKVDSRLLYFKPKPDPGQIPREEEFWNFIKHCFRQPRRTLRNNLQQTHYDVGMLSDKELSLRAQQMSKDDLITIWKRLITV